MANANSGAFAPVPEKPINKFLIETAEQRAADDGIEFRDALGKVRAENPPLANAARLEQLGISNGGRPGKNFLELMRRALAKCKAKGLSIEAALEQEAAADPDTAQAARQEIGGSLYASELYIPPGIGNRRVLLAEGAEAALDPQAHLVKLAEERCRERNVNYVVALSEIAREHPDLARAAREQALGVKPGF